jgi:hypothetical protein
MSNLGKNTALVTGASRGIGRATAVALAKGGARVTPQGNAHLARPQFLAIAPVHRRSPSGTTSRDHRIRGGRCDYRGRSGRRSRLAGNKNVSTIPSFSLNRYGVVGKEVIVPAHALAEYPVHLDPIGATSVRPHIIVFLKPLWNHRYLPKQGWLSVFFGEEEFTNLLRMLCAS